MVGTLRFALPTLRSHATAFQETILWSHADHKPADHLQRTFEQFQLI
jgi:hypothetical protein